MGRKSKADERRSEIIQAFHQCVVDQGMAAASIRKTATRAGVKPSTLHHYFKNRDEIIEEAVTAFTNGIFRRFRDQMAAAGAERDGLSEAERVDAGLAFIFSGGMINDDHTGFFLECCAAARNNPRIKASLAELFARFRGAITEHLARVPGFDSLPPRRQALLAASVVAIHEGIELQWFADPGGVDLDGTLDVTRGIIRFFIENGGVSSSKGG